MLRSAVTLNDNGLSFPSVIDTTKERSQKFSDVIYNWKNKNDVFYQKYGGFLLCGAVALSSFYVTNYFRRYFRLDHYARATMYLSTVYFTRYAFVARVTNYSLHSRSLSAGMFNQFYTARYLISHGDSCIMCIALKNAVFQMAASTLYPVVLAAGMGMFYATKYYTYKFPVDVLASKTATIKAAKIIWQVMNYRKSFFLNVLGCILVANGFGGYYVAERQQREVYNVYQQLLEQQEMLIQQAKEKKSGPARAVDTL